MYHIGMLQIHMNSAGCMACIACHRLQKSINSPNNEWRDYSIVLIIAFPMHFQLPIKTFYFTSTFIPTFNYFSLEFYEVLNKYLTFAAFSWKLCACNYAKHVIPSLHKSTTVIIQNIETVHSNRTNWRPT